MTTSLHAAGRSAARALRLMVLAGLLVGVVSSAATALPWGPGQPLAPSILADAETEDSLAGAVFGDGSRLAAWTDNKSYGLWVAFGTPSGTFAAPQRLARTDAPIGPGSLTIDPAGDAVLRWWSDRVAVRRPGQPFGPVQRLASIRGDKQTLAGGVTMDGAGNAVMTGVHYRVFGDLQHTEDPGGLIVYSKPARTSRFGHPQSLAPPAAEADDRTVMLRSGALISWIGCRRPNTKHSPTFHCATTLNVAIAGRSLVFDRPQSLGSLYVRSDARSAYRRLKGYAVAPLPGGGAVVVWGTNDRRPRVMEGVVAPHSTRIRNVRTISSRGVAAVLPNLALDRSGTGLAVWEERRGGHSRVVGASVAPNGRIGAPRPLSPQGADAAAPNVLVNPAGATLVDWVAPGDEARLMSHLAGAPFGPVSALPIDRNTLLFQPFTLDDAGEAFATWSHGGQTYAALWRADAHPSPILFPPNAIITRLTPSGRAFALAYQDPGDGSDLRLQAAVREPGQPFGPFQDLGPGIPELLATNASGAALVLKDLGESLDDIRAARSVVGTGKNLTALSSG